MASSVGNVTSEPDPTMVLIEPAKKPTPSTSSASRTDIVPGTVDWPPCPTRSHQSTSALDLFVYAPVGMALYVRDMFPSMMGIFVSRGKA